MDLSGEPPVIELFDLLGHDSKEVRIPSQGLVQPPRHGEEVSCSKVARGEELSKEGHIFISLPVGKAGDMSIGQLLNKLGLDTEALANRDPDFNSVSIDDVALWQRCQCLLV